MALFFAPWRLARIIQKKDFLTINSIIMKDNNQMQNDPGCCMPGSDCCSGMTDMGCC